MELWGPGSTRWWSDPQMSLREKVNLCGSRDLCWKLYSKTCFDEKEKLRRRHWLWRIFYSYNSVNETTWKVLHINCANKRQNLLVNLCLLLNTFLDKAGHTSGFDENLDALCKVHPVVDRLSDSVSHVGLKIGLSLHCQFKLVAKNSCNNCEADKHIGTTRSWKCICTALSAGMKPVKHMQASTGKAGGAQQSQSFITGLGAHLQLCGDIWKQTVEKSKQSSTSKPGAVGLIHNWVIVQQTWKLKAELADLAFKLLISMFQCGVECSVCVCVCLRVYVCFWCLCVCVSVF